MEREQALREALEHLANYWEALTAHGGNISKPVKDCLRQCVKELRAALPASSTAGEPFDARAAFDAWYEEYPDTTPYDEGMFDAFKAGIAAAPTLQDPESTNLVQSATANGEESTVTGKREHFHSPLAKAASGPAGAAPRFIVEGFCGGDYAGVYDRKHEVDVSQYTERNHFTREQLERIADELNAKYEAPGAAPWSGRGK